jgi:transcriptional regulator with XRE-family HTH domain
MQFRIREALREKGITALALAGQIGMTQANLSNIMTGKTTPPLGTLEEIAKALDMKIIDLFARDESNFTALIDHGGILRRFDSIEALKAYISEVE